MTNRYDELAGLLRGLKLPTMAASFSEIAVKAAKAGLTHEAFLYELARLESEHRAQRLTARRLQQAHLPLDMTFQTLDLSRFPAVVRQQVEHLRQGVFVQQAINVVAVGRPGVGKSHLAAAVGYALVEQGSSVLWTSTAQLVQQLLAARRDLRLPHELARLDRFACLILDDIGYLQHDRDEMEVLFTLLAERYERRSVVITTNLVFSEWTRIFKDPMTTMAAIDRVIHHSVILDLMPVESYRAQTASEQQRPALLRPPTSPVSMEAEMPETRAD
jgi:DNA replication protein DnaC